MNASKAPHLIDAEVASALRRATSTDVLTPEAGWTALDTWRRLGVTRHPVVGLLDRVWQLRENVTAYSAACVALARRWTAPSSPPMPVCHGHPGSAAR